MIFGNRPLCKIHIQNEEAIVKNVCAFQLNWIEFDWSEEWELYVCAVKTNFITETGLVSKTIL